MKAYFAYTPVGRRREGHAKRLLEWVERKGQEEDQQRIKSLVGSWDGFCLHRSMGHEMWGLERKRGEIVVDAAWGSWQERRRGCRRGCR